MKNATDINTGLENSILAGYVTPGELCRQLGKTRRTVDRWHARGLGPPRIRVERMVLYRIMDVRSWLEAHLERRDVRRGQVAGSGSGGTGK
jgi:predicted DNA-binding transcriptional regulator AlpA